MNRSRKKPTSCSAVPGSSPSKSAYFMTLLPFPLSFSSPHFLSSSFFFSFLLSFLFSYFISLFLSSLSLCLTCSPLLLQTSSFIHACICMHFNTWVAMCLTCICMHVDTWLAMCHPTPLASKNVKFRLSRNSTKFA